ncbi:hypothetical protein LOTGIDRAFT_239159 [Lottia gigantea]|uniref:C-type lectin domain-containing protein n=1 Tax=Lottia gigantea TaxID=225164 RepID=V4C6D4_LOTGI|nr:hypothetical protein LOTGIDRAFT_239159 [Lottia gigantea]ESO97219.1 hypothetical protein LOTGIDRAFT_239159 [Lottia gigantea]
MNVFLSLALFAVLAIGAQSAITGFATCDNNMKFYADGVLKASNNDWTVASAVTIPDNTEVVAVYCKDLHVVGGIKVALSNGIKTDKSWKCTTKYVPNWNKPGFDDSAWSVPTVPNFNWGTRPSQLNGKAEWIWTSGWSGQHKDVYCRKELPKTDCQCCEDLKKQISAMDSKLDKLIRTVNMLNRPISPVIKSPREEVLRRV